jgi:glycosyltransferase involved in cell wall biosynthesis
MVHWERKYIFIQDSVLYPSSQRGVNHCFISYSRAMAEACPGQVWIYSSRRINSAGAQYIRPLSARLKVPSTNPQVSRLDNTFGGVIADLTARLFYSPFYGYIRTRIPQVFSVYDMIYEKFPQYFPPSLPQNSLHIQEKKECLERAALLVCISQNTANDILEMYPNIPKENIKVVYLGVDKLFFQKSKLEKIDKPYFLYVGNRDKYKNFLRFLRAFGKSGLANNFDLRIVSPLEVFLDNEELEAIRKYRLADRIHLEVGLPDEKLGERYRQAYAFTYPSEYEGFGLPVLEALASGTIVLASQVASIPEVGADIPLYFEPRSEESITATLIEACHMSESERLVRINKGIARAEQFSWQASQAQFIQAIESIIH